MALTATEQKLLDFAKGSLPLWFTDSERETEFLAAAAKIMGQTHAQIVDWFKNTLISTAVGAVSLDPDWLNQHAIDRGTARQGNETDVALRQRLQNVEDALTRPAIRAAAQLILDAEGIGGTVAILELKRDQAFFSSSSSDAGLGGAFTVADGSDTQRFTPSGGFAGLPFRTIEEERIFKLTTFIPAFGANGVTDEVITGLDGDAITYQNPGGLADPADGVVIWVVKKYDRDGNILDGFDDSYFGDTMPPSGAAPTDRMADINTLVIILPFGCTEGTRKSVEEMLRQKKGAGVAALVECRLNV